MQYLIKQDADILWTNPYTGNALDFAYRNLGIYISQNERFERQQIVRLLIQNCASSYLTQAQIKRTNENLASNPKKRRIRIKSKNFQILQRKKCYKNSFTSAVKLFIRRGEDVNQLITKENLKETVLTIATK